MILPKHIQERLINLRDDVEFFERRLKEARRELSDELLRLGLNEGVEITVSPMSTDTRKDTRVENPPESLES